MSKKLLDRALNRAESSAGLARALHVSPSTIGRWKREGAPKERQQSLKKFLATEREHETAARVDRQKFLELMKLAGNIDKLPDIRSHEKVRAGRLTSGVDYTRRFSEMLTLGVIDRIEVWAKKLKKRFPDWQLVAVVSQYGKGEHKGYKTVYHQIAPEAGDFAISAEVATPRVHTIGKALDLLREQLEAMAEDASVLVYLHAVTAFNYRLRTDEESSAWETMQRRKREPKTTTSRAVARGWGAHPTTGAAWPTPKPKPKAKKRATKKPARTTKRSSALRQSRKSSANAVRTRSERVSKRKGSERSTTMQKRSSKRPQAKTSKRVTKKSTKTLRTPSRKTTKVQATKQKQKGHKSKPKKPQEKRRNR